jgi:hypothetical protein
MVARPDPAIFPDKSAVLRGSGHSVDIVEWSCGIDINTVIAYD